ncbi:unnamed protein product [Hydatigera taeniaeformis]|uniref:Uncharacterized protein n=1 Tax=Hydatigena taeniaeformis TaxID=6205 RepID=A0A0R3X976_HYDTA|nr:unnamed protein product [Hydatigera taeniaeformis]
MDLVTNPSRNRCDGRCHSGSLLRPTSSQLRNPTCVLRSGSGHRSLHLKSLKQHGKLGRLTSIRSTKKDEKVVNNGDNETFEMHMGGEENEAFGGDMTVEEEGKEDDGPRED